jgi:hypothetical protein
VTLLTSRPSEPQWYKLPSNVTWSEYPTLVHPPQWASVIDTAPTKEIQLRSACPVSSNDLRRLLPVQVPSASDYARHVGALYFQSGCIYVWNLCLSSERVSHATVCMALLDAIEDTPALGRVLNERTRTMRARIGGITEADVAKVFAWLAQEYVSRAPLSNNAEFMGLRWEFGETFYDTFIRTRDIGLREMKTSSEILVRFLTMVEQVYSERGKPGSYYGTASPPELVSTAHDQYGSRSGSYVGKYTYDEFLDLFHDHSLLGRNGPALQQKTERAPRTAQTFTADEMLKEVEAATERALQLRLNESGAYAGSGAPAPPGTRTKEYGLKNLHMIVKDNLVWPQSDTSMPPHREKTPLANGTANPSGKCDHTTCPRCRTKGYAPRWTGTWKQYETKYNRPPFGKGAGDKQADPNVDFVTHYAELCRDGIKEVEAYCQAHSGKAALYLARYTPSEYAARFPNPSMQTSA